MEWNPNFNLAVSKVKSAQWLNLYRSPNFYKYNYEKLIKHDHLIGLFENNALPIDINLSRGSQAGVGILGWQDVKDLKNLKAYYYNEKKLFSPIIKAQLSRSVKRFKIITTMTKGRSKYFLFRLSYFKIPFMNGSKSELRPTKPWILAEFNQQQFPCSSDFLRLSQQEFILHNQYLSSFTKNDTSLSFPWLDKQTYYAILFKKNKAVACKFSSFFKFSILRLLTSFKNQKLKLNPGLSFKSKSISISDKMSTIPRKIMPRSSVKPHLLLGQLIGRTNSKLGFAMDVSFQKHRDGSVTGFRPIMGRSLILDDLQSGKRQANLGFLSDQSYRSYGSMKTDMSYRHALTKYMRKPKLEFKDNTRNFFFTSFLVERGYRRVAGQDYSFLFKPDNENSRGTNQNHNGLNLNSNSGRFEENKWPTLKKIGNISNTNLTKTEALTYSSEFYIPVQIIDQISKKMYLRWLLLADLPIQTKRGHFIINGYPKTVIHQIVRSPGIRFKNEDNQILADIISMRGAWMGIQIVYEKNLKAANVGLKSQVSPIFSLKTEPWRNTPNKIINKSSFQGYPENISNDFFSTDMFKAMGWSPNLANNFQQSKYSYQTSFLQNAIMKSAKIDHLPTSTLSTRVFNSPYNEISGHTTAARFFNKKPGCLLKTKSENKATQLFKHWPGAFFKSVINLQPALDVQRLVRSLPEGEGPELINSFNSFSAKRVSLASNNKPAVRPILKRLTPKLFKFPLNSIKESEKMNEALSINFFISSSRSDKTDKKRIKLSGFAFLDYLFDHPYFIYNNYIPSWQKSSFFPASVLMKNTVNTAFSTLPPYETDQATESDQRFWDKSSYPPYFTTNDTFLKNLAWRFLKKIKHTRFSKRWPALMQKSSFKIYPLLNDVNLSTCLTWLGSTPSLSSLPKFARRSLSKEIDSSFLVGNRHQNSNPLYDRIFFQQSRQKNLRIHTSLGKAKTDGINNQKLFIIQNQNLASNERLRKKFINSFSYLPYQNQKNNLWVLQKNHAGFLDHKFDQTLPLNSQQVAKRLKSPSSGRELSTSLSTTSKQIWANEFTNKPIKSEKILSSNQLLASLVSILNTTNFRDILFERFMNAKFYDIGLMGRKRLNKKLRLNIPLQCTTLTPLDFLAIFYKLFSLYNNFSLIQNFFPTDGRIPVKVPFLGDEFTLNSKANSWSESKSKIASSSGSIILSNLSNLNLKGTTLPLALPGIGNVFKPRQNLLDSTPLHGSLDHLNQRHIRTSGEFLFLQFWRAILRFYQVLSQLSSRSNFIKSSYTAAGKSGRSFFSLSNISLFPSTESTISNQTEYMLPISNNQTHVLKAYGYLNMTNSNDDAFNFNLYQHQCFQNTMAGEFYVTPRVSLQSNQADKPDVTGKTVNSNKITGFYPNNFRREILNIVINRNDLNSILPYTPYLQIQKTLSTSAQFQNFTPLHERAFGYARGSKTLLKVAQRDQLFNNQNYRTSPLFYMERNDKQNRQNANSLYQNEQIPDQLKSAGCFDLTKRWGIIWWGKQNLPSNSNKPSGGFILMTPSYLIKRRRSAIKSFGEKKINHQKSNLSETSTNLNSDKPPLDHEFLKTTASLKHVGSSQPEIWPWVSRESPSMKLGSRMINDYQVKLIEFITMGNPFYQKIQTRRYGPKLLQFHYMASLKSKPFQLSCFLDGFRSPNRFSMLNLFKIQTFGNSKKSNTLIKSRHWPGEKSEREKLFKIQSLKSRMFVNPPLTQYRLSHPEEPGPSDLSVKTGLAFGVKNSVLNSVFAKMERVFFNTPYLSPTSSRRQVGNDRKHRTSAFENKYVSAKNRSSQYDIFWGPAGRRNTPVVKRKKTKMSLTMGKYPNFNQPKLGSKIETIIKKLLYETKELRVYDAKERMRNLETKLFNGVFKEFFNLDPLSQDLDETNGLSEIIHKRRISALGKGGVTSKNAPLSIRSIHPSFYGRLCPIDSPEGDRVGLINSLTNYARINSIGYIATPFYRTRQHDEETVDVNGKDVGQRHQKFRFNLNPLLTKKSTLQMRICPPISFFGKIYNSSKISPTLRLSFQDIYDHKAKSRLGFFSQESRIINQNYAKQVILEIGSTQFERTYKYFMKSSDLRPDPLKNDSPEVSLLRRKSVTGNPFIYGSKQNYFKFTKIHEKNKGFSPIPSFGLSQNQQRGLVNNESMVSPYLVGENKSFRNTVQNNTVKAAINFDTPFLTYRPLPYKNKYTESSKLELFLFYDTHYMTPPITHHETIINNAKNKDNTQVYTPFLTSYFDFRSFQGYAPITAFQFFSPGVGLIPFLEHDDGTRALMGANMQRQAVPLISASRPIVGTGLEKNVAASFIISSTNSGYLYYISGKQSKQIFTSFGSALYSSKKLACFKSNKLVTRNKLIKETAVFSLPTWLDQIRGRRNSRLGFATSVNGSYKLENPLKDMKPEKTLSIKKPVYTSENSSSLKMNTSFRTGLSLVGKDLTPLEEIEMSKAIKKYPDSPRTWLGSACGLSRIGARTMVVKKANPGFKQSKAKNTYRSLSYNFKNDHHFILNTHWLPYRKSYKATIINKKPAIESNSWLQKGDLLVDSTSSINGELALGRNLFSIYMPWEGYNFEDAILISDKAAQSYTTIHVEEFSVKISKNEFVSSIVKPFTWVNLGDILVSKKRKLENEFIMNRLLFGMSSKPKIKNLPQRSSTTQLDNNSSLDGPSNYSFYGNKSFLNLQEEPILSLDLPTHRQKETLMGNSSNSLKSSNSSLGGTKSAKPFISLPYKKKFVANGFSGHKKKDSRKFLANSKDDYFLQNFHELDSVFSKVTISGETSFVTEQAFRTYNETNLSTGIILDDKASSLVRMNQKDLKLNATQSSLGAPVKKNDNFEIDTSYRTGESICGWVIAVKSQSKHTLFSNQPSNEINVNSGHKDRVRVLDPKTRMVQQTHSKDSMGLSTSSKFPSISNPTAPVSGTQQAEPLKSMNVLNDLNHKSSKSLDLNFNGKKTASITLPSLKPLRGIYAGSIQKFLSLLSIFSKNIQFTTQGSLMSYEPTYSVVSRKRQILSSPEPVSLKNSLGWPATPIGYLLLKSTLKTLSFSYQSSKKPNQINLKWLVFDSHLQFLKKLSFRSPYSSIFKDKSYLFNVNNSYTIPRIKTEHTKALPVVSHQAKPWGESQLKVTKNLKARPGSDPIYIYIAVAKPLQVGDKMSGRHGNKGIISKILPFYDMPYLIDGTPIDIVLNPLGVPSRMNVGQIYESLLGLTGFYKQEYYRIPPFDENYSFQFSRNFVYWKLNELKNLHFFTPQISTVSYRQKPSQMSGQPKSTIDFGFAKTSLFQNVAQRAQKVFDYKTFLPVFVPQRNNDLASSLSKAKNHLHLYKDLNAFKWLGPNNLPNKARWVFAHRYFYKKHLGELVSGFIPSLFYTLFVHQTCETMRWNPYLVNRNLKISKYIKTRLTFCATFNRFYDTLNSFCHCQKSSNYGSLKTGLPINWNTSLLGCSKSKILNGENNSSESKCFNIISNSNSIYSVKSSSPAGPFKENWFFNFKHIQAKPFSLSKQTIRDLSFSSPKHSENTWFINQNRPNFEKFGLNPYFPGKMRLLNGLTGETFYRPIIVGKSYMLKLIHLVHHKIHARATGPYALITQQPLKGKRNQGGQRMGEMEIWALYGFGSASILYEMLTIKSDDPVGRERILRDIAGLKGNNSSSSNWKTNENSNALSLREPISSWKNEESGFASKVNDSLEKGISESFRVLVMNLRALCLDMQVFKDLPNQ